MALDIFYRLKSPRLLSCTKFYFIARGVPSQIQAQTTRTNHIGPNQIPTRTEAKIEYEGTYDGRLTDEHPFGQDPLGQNDELVRERERLFFQRFRIEEIFSQCVNEQPQLFKDSILFFIDASFK